MSSTLAPPLEEAARTDVLAPLRFFYGLAHESPHVTFLDAAALPPAERWQLVHDYDMTGRLREHHGSEIVLDVHAKARRYSRTDFMGGTDSVRSVSVISMTQPRW